MTLEAPCQGASNEFPQHMLFFYEEIGKIIPELSSNIP